MMLDCTKNQSGVHTYVCTESLSITRTIGHSTVATTQSSTNKPRTYVRMYIACMQVSQVCVAVMLKVTRGPAAGSVYKEMPQATMLHATSLIL